MPGRKRSAKMLGTRHDLNYFKHATLFRKWRFWLSVGLPIVALAWLAGQGLSGHEVAYSAGPLSAAHAVFGKQCSTCHVSETHAQAASFRKHVPDSACLNCHQAPAHHADQAFTPECSNCHREHTGSLMLAKVPDVSCTQCHGDLHLLGGGTPDFVAKINGFNTDHPEFAAKREPGLDPGTIAFNHALHLKEGLLGPNGRRVDLQCNDCHRPTAEAEAERWPYAAPGLVRAAEKSMASTGSGHMELDPNAGRALMAPVTYAKNCSGCHTLQFDRRFAASVPHEKPEIVDAFLIAQFKDYLGRNPGAWREPERVSRLQTGTDIRNYLQTSQIVQARSPQEWMNQRVDESERLLWGKTCRQCHQFEYPQAGQPGVLPQVKPAQITERWFRHAVFSHQSHQALECIACHAAALTSTDTRDVLVPSIKTCQSCHNGEPTKYGHAENRCFECHQYHNWSDRQPGFKGNYNIPGLVGEAKQPAKQGAGSFAALLASMQ